MGQRIKFHKGNQYQYFVQQFPNTWYKAYYAAYYGIPFDREFIVVDDIGLKYVLMAVVGREYIYITKKWLDEKMKCL